MATNFLFDGSNASKDMLKLFILYNDDGFKISPSSYLSVFFNKDSSSPIDNMRDLEKYEKQLDTAINFVEESTLKQLNSDDLKLFNRFIEEYVDLFRNTPEHADPALETGEDGLTYVNLIAPELLDVFKNNTDSLRLNTFKYRLSINNAFAISSVVNPQDNIVATENSRRIIETFRINLPISKIFHTVNRATSILLPNYSSLSLVDTMELKLKAKDALEEMNYFLYSVLHGFNGDMESLEIAIRDKVEPAIRRLECKIRGLKYGLAQKALSELKNPMSYTPLIIGLVSNAPQAASLSASLALIASGVALDYLKQRDEIKSEPLYCIYKLREIAKKNQSHL